MIRPLALLALFCLPGVCADWAMFKSGPLEVYSNGDDDAARRVLATFDQERWLLSRWMGRDALTPVWTVRIVVVKQDKTSAKYRTPHIQQVRDGYTAGMTSKDSVPVAWIRDFATILLRDDTRNMPAAMETALADLASTLEVRATMLTVGTPPEPARRTKDWARLHLLCIDPTYAGRVRVFFSNLQQSAPLDVAYRNAFEKTEKQMEAEVDRYFAAGQFAPQSISGKPLNPDRDYRARVVEPLHARIVLADVTQDKAAYKAIIAEGTNNPDAYEGAGMFTEAVSWKSESATAWVGAAAQIKDPDRARQALLRAMDLNKRWIEPHLRLAALEIDAGRRAVILKRALEVDPRATSVWVDLAEAQQEARDFSGASVSWRNAVRSAPNDAQRAAIDKRQKDYEQKRLDLIAAEKKREQEEKERELARLREEALANIRAAENRANRDKASDPSQKVVEWWDGPKPAGTATGKLERVDCVRGQLKLNVRTAEGKLAQYTVLKPGEIVVSGAADATLGCGVQRPAPTVKVDYNDKGQVMAVEFQQ